MIYLLQNYLVDLSAEEIGYADAKPKQLIGTSWTKIKAARQTRATAANDTSSRTHLIIKAELTPVNGVDDVPRTLYILDLAGAEALGTNKAESIFINSTLLSLNKLMKALAASAFVPWRDSSLNMRLHTLLKGLISPKITLISCIDLAEDKYDSTTLEFASTCLAVKRSNLELDAVLDKAIKWQKKIAAADPNAPEVAELKEVIGAAYSTLH